MTVQKHGLSIGIERIGSEFYLSFRAVGKLTHEDYEVITPMIDSALQGVTNPRINALFDMTELEGWKPRAAWDDLKLGIKHGGDFNKVALYGSSKWQEGAAKIASWFMSGEARFFNNEADAVAWLKQ